MSHLASSALLSTFVALALLAPAPAKACGGTFCDSGPTPMPVDQTGEDILFIDDGDMMEVHVRIQYTGEAERFAWMVPLANIPAVSLGSEELFRNLSSATIPVWSTSRTFEDPNDQPPPTGTSLGFTPDDGGGGSEPKVVLDELVGDFEVVVLSGGTASEVIEFFIANDYAFEDEAEPLIQEYIDEGFLITGIKLQAGASVEAIQPLVFRFAASEPCVPIRLTSVAARDDMGIRAYFLGDSRWAPTNYKHVVMNPMAFDWVNLDFTTYVRSLSRAVDEAGGQAFVTEYAGPSTTVSTNGVYDPSWTSEGMAQMGHHELLVTLEDFGLMPLNVTPRQSLIALMREFLPPPSNWPLSDVGFWWRYLYNPALMGAGGESGGGQIGDAGGFPNGQFGDLEPLDWDLAGFEAGFEERIVAPGLHAVELLDNWSYLTRLHTTMSAHEMTLDPTFHPIQLNAVRERRSTASVVLDDFAWTTYDVPLAITGLAAEVESTLQLCVEDDGNWPWSSTPIEDMPRALRIEEIPVSGPVQVLTDNEDAIREAVQRHNIGSPCSSGDPVGGDESGSGESGDPGVGEGTASCGCVSDPGGAGGLGLGLLALLGLRRRRD